MLLRAVTAAAALVAALVPRLNAQTPWSTLVTVTGHVIEIDTGSLTRAPDSTFTVQLRWWEPASPGLGRPDFVERTQVDCRNHRMRVLAKRTEIDAVPQPRSAAPPDSTRWISYVPGSLGAEVQRAACTRYGASGAGGTRAGV